MASSTSTSNNDCISIRARVRKSHRAIDPDFDVCREMLVSFVIGAADPQQQQRGSSKTNSSSSSKKGPSLVLTPLPCSSMMMTTSMTPRARSLSFTNYGSSGHGSHGRGLSPLNHSLRRSVGSGGMVTLTTTNTVSVPRSASQNMDSADLNDTDMMMMEVSLEDDTGDQQRQQQQQNNALSSNNNKVLGLPPTQPSTLLSSSSSAHPQNQLLRHPSPLVMHRSSSGGGGGASSSNHTNISTSYSDPPLGGMGPHSLRSRSRSRSRSIGNNNRRLRSLGAAVIFANAAAAASSSSLGSSNHSNPQQQQQQQIDNNLEGGHEMSSSAVYYEFDPITIPLVDILGVDEEVPSSSSSSRKRSGSSGGGGSASGCGNNNNSEFYSSAASDIGVAKEVASAATGSATSYDQHQNLPPLLTSPPPSTSHGGSGGRPSHRIFLHTLSSGYLEFSLDNANSHDSFMAYLKAHLPSDRIPCRSSIGSSSYISSSAPTKVTNNVGMLRTMVLTPTKEVPSNLSGNSTTTTITGNIHAASHSKHQQLDTHQSSPPPTPTIVPSSSTSVCSNRIDKLHSKMMHQRLQYEKQSRPPLTRIKERMVNWMSSVIDCGCCLDTTVAPLETTSSSVSGTGTGSAPYKETTPNTKALKKKGIGGLSFEVETPPMPSLSFERF